MTALPPRSRLRRSSQPPARRQKGLVGYAPKPCWERGFWPMRLSIHKHHQRDKAAKREEK